MFLKSLAISSEGQSIREIQFHKGLNLIVDETPSTKGKETGNNVGKTTVLMLIDFCLGASAKHIYTDPENKKEEYKLVKDYLIGNKIVIKLTLKEDLEQDKSREVVIERNFLSRRSKVQRVAGIERSDIEFDEALTNLLFPNHYGKKPTFRQIISHNIRYRDLSINNTLKTLDGYTRDDEYETLYLFLLGCDFEQGDTKQELRAQLRVEEAFKSRLEKEQTRSAYETALNILEGELEVLERRKSNFNLNENFAKDLDKLNQIRLQINMRSSEIAKLNIRRNLIREAEQDLLAGVSNIDLQQLQQIYQQAKAKIDNIQRSFDELYHFHNRMVVEKVRYITKDLPKLEAAILAQKNELQFFLQEEAALARVITQSESFEELEELITEINEKFRKKGEYENIISQLKHIDTNLSKLGNKLDAIDDELFSEESETKIKEQVHKFNRHFATISQALYGEKYAIKADPKINKKGQRLYQFSAFNTNFSSGKKQGEISCFDIAYTLFADQENIPCMHFLLNDKKELMHDNQLLKIANLVDEKNVQFIASILRDKLPIELDQEKYIIVKLSQADKLFRIEQGPKAAPLVS